MAKLIVDTAKKASLGKHPKTRYFEDPVDENSMQYRKEHESEKWRDALLLVHTENICSMRQHEVGTLPH